MILDTSINKMKQLEKLRPIKLSMRCSLRARALKCWRMAQKGR